MVVFTEGRVIMRDILFKGKAIISEEWVEGSLVILSENDYRIVTKYDSECAYTSGSIYDGDMTRVDASTICQYTGLTDKNGNKIWENDVVEVWWKQRTLEEDFEPQRYKAIIEYGNPNGLYSWGWQLRFLEDFPHNPDILLWIDMEECGAYCEVIDSIFDNPELLKGE